MIEVKNLTKEFTLNKKQVKAEKLESNQVKAVDDLSFTCQPGRIFGLLGPNGAGKTSTLRCIATILKPTSGSIQIQGLDSVDSPKEVKRKLGFLTGATGLYERLSATEMVKYFADLNDVSKEKFKLEQDRIFTLLDIWEFADKRIGKLSTGMKQKVSIARTMIHDPEVVVFDEPTSGLDVITAKNIIELLKDCKERQKTVLFSTHIMGEVSLLCDDIMVINKGKSVFEGSFQEFEALDQDKNLVSQFIKIIENSEHV